MEHMPQKFFVSEHITKTERSDSVVYIPLNPKHKSMGQNKSGIGTYYNIF